MKNIFKLLPICFPLILAGCGNKNNTSNSQDNLITVYFYIDFVKIDDDDGLFSTVQIKNKSKITDPGTPNVAPYAEFPVFKGWSEHEIVDDLDQLWNFSKDVVNVTGTTKFRLYGIWWAE